MPRLIVPRTLGISCVESVPLPRSLRVFHEGECCFLGRMSRLSAFFRGFLAGLALLEVWALLGLLAIRRQRIVARETCLGLVFLEYCGSLSQPLVS